MFVQRSLPAVYRARDKRLLTASPVHLANLACLTLASDVDATSCSSLIPRRVELGDGLADAVQLVCPSCERIVFSDGAAARTARPLRWSATPWSTPSLALPVAWLRCARQSKCARAEPHRASTYPLVSLSVRAQVETKKGDDSTLEAAKKVIQVRIALTALLILSVMAFPGYTTACPHRSAASP